MSSFFTCTEHAKMLEMSAKKIFYKE